MSLFGILYMPLLSIIKFCIVTGLKVPLKVFFILGKLSQTMHFISLQGLMLWLQLFLSVCKLSHPMKLTMKVLSHFFKTQACETIRPITRLGK